MIKDHYIAENMLKELIAARRITFKKCRRMLKVKYVGLKTFTALTCKYRHITVPDLLWIRSPLGVRESDIIYIIHCN